MSEGDICVQINYSLRCTAETNRTLYSSYTLIIIYQSLLTHKKNLIYKDVSYI